MGARMFLLQRVAGVRRQIEELELALATEEERLALVERLLELSGDAVENPSEMSDASDRLTWSSIARMPQASGSELRDDEIERAVEEVLREEEAPLHIANIRTKLIERGVDIPGRGDEANVIVRLRRDPKRFTRVARGTYALPEWGLPSIDRPKKRTTKAKA